MRAELNARFSFSKNCYYDPMTHSMIDEENGRIIGYTTLNMNEEAVLCRLMRAYPGSVSKEELRRVIGAFCGEDEVRRVMSELKKRHPQLKLWIPRARDGEYRLLKPAAQDEPDRTSAPAPQRQSCTLKSTGICVRPNFVKEARADIFAQLDEAFQESHVVFLQGIGGIGKSEAAKHWALQKKKEGLFDTVVFAQLNSETSNSSVQSLVADDTIFVISGPFRSRDENESVEDYFHRKLAKIMQITDERTLIVIDNYDIDDPQLAALFAGSHRLLVTTRNRQSGYDFPLIPVTEIRETEHLKRIFFKNLAGERDDIEPEDPYIERLFTLVSNHTLTIEIIAKSLVNSADTPESLYRKIGDPEQHTLMRHVDGLVDRNFSEEPLTPFECIRVLFNLSRLEQDKDFEYKSQVLVFLAAMPTRGIELSLFKKWSDSRIIRAKNSLVRKSWLRQTAVEGVTFISMHPLIREIVWHELKPTLEKCSMIIEMLQNDDLFYIDELFHLPVEVKDSYSSIAYSLLASFSDYNIRHFELYVILHQIFSHSSKSETALMVVKNLLNRLEEAKETTTWRYGYVKSKIATAYAFYYRDYGEETLRNYTDAVAIMSKTAVTHRQRLILAFLYREICNVLCNGCLNGKLTVGVETLEAYLEKGWKTYADLIAEGFSHPCANVYYGTLLVWRSKIALIRNDFSSAEELINRADQEFERLGYINALDKSTVLDVKAVIHHERGEYEQEAIRLLEAIAVSNTGFGKLHRSTIERAIKLAAAYQSLGKNGDAARILMQYQKISVEMFGNEAELTRSINAQLAGLAIR